MENNREHMRLTSIEITSIWLSYESETLSKCGIEFFLVHIEDEDIKQLLSEALSYTNERIKKLVQFFEGEGYPVPRGFTINDDVNINAPRLFSDQMYLQYILNNTKLNMVSYSFSLMNVARSDLLIFYNDILEENDTLHIKAKELMKKKGIYIYPPYLPIPKHIDFVKSQNFLAGWFGDRRPLLGMEIGALVFNAKRNALGQAVITGFSQVAKDKEVRKYFERGRDISGKHLNVFGKILYEDFLSEAALLMTSEVTDSTVAPFSDKLMMTLITTLIGSGIGEYGAAMSMSPRRDLGVQYTKLMTEIAKYAEDGIEIMIENGWMEQPPMAANRKDLAK